MPLTPPFLTADALELIERWYYSAAGESNSGSGTAEENERLKRVLAELGIDEYHPGDVYMFEHPSER